MAVAPVTVGVSLKMYFGHRQARDWLEQVAGIVRAPGAAGDAVRDGSVELFVIPGYLDIVPAIEAFAGTRVAIGAQDLATADSGAFTGEVSGTELAEVGVRIAEVGHAERRRLFGETEQVVADKAEAALRNGLTPVLCVGEPDQTDPVRAVEICREQLSSALRRAGEGRIIVAYEPVWAIGAERSAPPAHAREVCRGLREALLRLPARAGSSIIYGGSARPGTLGDLWPEADGLFLGRFGHDPRAVEAVLGEAAELAALNMPGPSSG